MALSGTRRSRRTHCLLASQSSLGAPIIAQRGDALLAATPLGRFGRPEEVASVIAFLNVVDESSEPQWQLEATAAAAASRASEVPATELPAPELPAPELMADGSVPAANGYRRVYRLGGGSGNSCLLQRVRETLRECVRRKLS